MLTFICHPRCTTCKKARDFLDGRGVQYTVRDITSQNPTPDELRAWHELSGAGIRKLFNTSGIQYRALGLKDKLDSMSEDEALELLATDGMLVKRPVLVGEGFVLFGFRQSEWEAQITE